MKLRKGDTVKVLSGNDKGKTGEILEVIPKTEKIIVKGINIRKKSVKPRRQGEQGGRVGYVVENGEKVRVCKKCGAKIK